MFCLCANTRSDVSSRISIILEVGKNKMFTATIPGENGVNAVDDRLNYRDPVSSNHGFLWGARMTYILDSLLHVYLVRGQHLTSV